MCVCVYCLDKGDLLTVYDLIYTYIYWALTVACSRIMRLVSEEGEESGNGRRKIQVVILDLSS